MTDAREFNRRQVETGKLTVDHVTELVRAWQRERGLDDDGKAGAITIASIESTMATTHFALPVKRCWPMRALADGRKPTVTSGFRNPERRNHSGCDVMFRYDPAKDPKVPIGDGGRTKSWWIPPGTMAIAQADGVVELASMTGTGWRVWIRHSGGYATGSFHLSSIVVAVGDAVVMGDPLGTISDNPIDNDPDHLHAELVRGDLAHVAANRVDPETFWRGAVVLGPA